MFISKVNFNNNNGCTRRNNKQNINTQLKSVKFKGSLDTKENLFVPSVSNFHLYKYGYKVNLADGVVKKLNTLVMDKKEHPEVKYISIESDDNKPNEDKETRLWIKRNDEQFEKVKPGFSVGKAGTFGVIDTHDFTVILPENSGIDAPDFKYSNKLTFKGTRSIVNCFYRADKTHQAVNDFYNKVIPNYLQDDKVKKQHEDNVQKYGKKFQSYMLAGGFGSRLEPISYVNEDNKPSTPTTIKDFPLMGFTMLNLWQAGILSSNKKDILYDDQTKPNSAVGCFVTTVGYKINEDYDISLGKDDNSIIDKNKNIVVVPADNVTDIQLDKVLDSFLAKKDAGMMVVSVPDTRAYGGLIMSNDKDEIIDFVSKEGDYIVPEDKEAYLQNYINASDENKAKVEKYGIMGKTKDGKPQYAGNGFIYILHPDMVDKVADIYGDKIKEAYNKYKQKNNITSVNQIPEDDRTDIKECLWDREVIPKFVEMAKNGKLYDKKGNSLKVYTCKVTDTDWNDVGQLKKESFIKTMKEIADDDKYKHLPKSLKNEAKNNIEKTEDGGTLLYLNSNAVTRDKFKSMFKNQKAYGDLIVVGKDDEHHSKFLEQTV